MGVPRKSSEVDCQIETNPESVSLPTTGTVECGDMLKHNRKETVRQETEEIFKLFMDLEDGTGMCLYWPLCQTFTSVVIRQLSNAVLQHQYREREMLTPVTIFFFLDFIFYILMMIVWEVVFMCTNKLLNITVQYLLPFFLLNLPPPLALPPLTPFSSLWKEN